MGELSIKYPDYEWTDCMVVGCGQAGLAHICPGDGRYHHHGAIHTKPDTKLDLGPWGWLCNVHFAIAKEEWGTRPWEK